MLANELKKVEYDGLSHQSTIDKLNLKNITVVGEISKRDLLKWATKKNLLIKFEYNKTNHSDETVRNICAAILTMLSSDQYKTNLSDQEIVGMIDYLVLKSILTSTHKTELTTLATRSISRAEQLGVANVTISDIIQARNENARSITDQDIHDKIFADATAKALADSGDDDRAARRLNELLCSTCFDANTVSRVWGRYRTDGRII